VRIWGRQGRASAADDYIDADRRLVAERVAEIFRWLFVLILFILNNFGGLQLAGARLFSNGVLVAWALFNLGVTVLLVRGFKPGRQFGLLTTAVDLAAGALLVYTSSGLTSPYILALFLAIIASAIRFGTAYSLLCAAVIGFVYLFVGGTVPADYARDPQLGLTTAGRIFLFFVVALVTGLMGDELRRERRLAVSRAAQAESLQQMSGALAYSLDVSDLFEVILQQAVKVSNADSGQLILHTGGRLQLAAFHGQGGKSDRVAIEKGDPLTQRVAATGDALHIKDTRSYGGPEPIGASPPLSLMLVPILVQDRVAAIMKVVAFTRANAFTDQQFFMLGALAASAAGPLSNSLRYERKTREAITDGLTGLLNHREFRRRLEIEFSRYRRKGTPLGLMIIDVDLFKTVNDSMGHQHGDEVLRAAADLVARAVREHDLVSRYGGDEMAVILPDTSAAEAATTAARLTKIVRDAAIHATSTRDLTLSIGIAGCPQDAITSDELLMAADEALYYAKRLGRDRCLSFADVVSEFARDRQALSRAIVESGPQLVAAISRAVALSDPGGTQHTSRIAAFAHAIARKLGRHDQELELVRTAALLHEIGRLEAGTDVRHHDWMSEHGVLAERVIQRGNFLPELVEIIRHHHERWDGKGKPDGLAGEQIPLLARVLAVADAFDQLTSDDEHPLSPVDALDRLADDGGKAYDQHVVDGLASLVGEGERLGSILRMPPRVIQTA